MADGRSLALRSNIHAHSSFSDGRNAPEEMVQAALARGFVSFGLSDHGYAPHDVCSMSLEGEARYRAEMRALKEKYAGRIELALGYEHDASMPEADLTPYDYVIESVHFIRRGGEYTSVDASAAQLQGLIDLHFGGDPYAMCADYFESVCRSIMDTPGQIAGHIGLVSKFNEGGRMFDAGSPRYLRPAKEAAPLRRRARPAGRGQHRRDVARLPHGAVSRARAARASAFRARRQDHPHHGLPPRRVGRLRARRRPPQLARACGFRESWIWKDGGFQPVAL